MATDQQAIGVSPRQSPLERLAGELGKLPGIGRKTAEKLAYHLLRAPKSDTDLLIGAIRAVKEDMRVCSQCFNLAECDPCPICRDLTRDKTRICVVEQPKDLHSIEKSGAYHGLYHVLTGRVSPLEGSHAEDLTINALRQRIERMVKETPPVTEVILATNPDFEGDGTALYVREALANLPVKVTQLARGIPQGASIEFVATSILADAFKGRRETERPTNVVVGGAPS